MSNKLTDKEIVKALECYSDGVCCKCDHEDEYLIETIFNALDLINRLQAEKEALINGQETLQKYIAEQKAENEKLKNMVSQNEGVLPEYENLIKSEAYKEFAERLKERFPSYDEPYQYWEIHEFADNFLKELVGEDNG